jgi:hypothetical protein
MLRCNVLLEFLKKVLDKECGEYYNTDTGSKI